MLQRFVVLDEHDDPPVEVRAPVADPQRRQGRSRTGGPARGGRGTRRSLRPSQRRRPGRRPGSPGRGGAAASATRTRADRRGRAPPGRRGSTPRRRGARRATTRAPGRTAALGIAAVAECRREQDHRTGPGVGERQGDRSLLSRRTARPPARSARGRRRGSRAGPASPPGSPARAGPDR